VNIQMKDDLIQKQDGQFCCCITTVSSREGKKKDLKQDTPGLTHMKDVHQPTRGP